MRSILLFMLCAGLCAEDIKLKNGEVIQGVTEIRAKMRGLQITHETGIAMVPYDRLPDDLRAKYAEAEKVNAAKLKRWKARQKRKAELEKREKLYLMHSGEDIKRDGILQVKSYTYKVEKVYQLGMTVRTIVTWQAGSARKEWEKELIFVEGLPKNYTSGMELDEKIPVYGCGNILMIGGRSLKRYSADINAKPYDYTRKAKRKGMFLIVD